MTELPKAPAEMDENSKTHGDGVVLTYLMLTYIGMVLALGGTAWIGFEYYFTHLKAGPAQGLMVIPGWLLQIVGATLGLIGQVFLPFVKKTDRSSWWVVFGPIVSLILVAIPFIAFYLAVAHFR